MVPRRTGKTLAGAKVARSLGVQLAVVFALTIALTQQTLRVWAVQQRLGRARKLYICPDETVGDDNDAGAPVSDLDTTATTDAMVVARASLWLYSIPFTFRSSMPIVWKRRVMLLVS